MSETTQSAGLIRLPKPLALEAVALGDLADVQLGRHRAFRHDGAGLVNHDPPKLHLVAKIVALFAALMTIAAVSAVPASASSQPASQSTTAVVTRQLTVAPARVPTFWGGREGSGVRMYFTFFETGVIAGTSAMWPVLAAASILAPWATPALIWGSGRIMWAAIWAGQMNDPPRCLTIWIPILKPKNFTTGSYACSK